ncbi:MAG: hypothetical protein PVG65_01040 [Candidatus Thorarchaeota archaeon]|jgi:hypothetical protein
MLKVAYELIKDFGALGVNLVQFGVILYFGAKIIKNHLQHLKDKIDSLCTRQKAVEDELVEQGKKIAKIEGKLE